jgi:hypothetical protein
MTDCKVHHQICKYEFELYGEIRSGSSADHIKRCNKYRELSGKAFAAMLGEPLTNDCGTSGHKWIETTTFSSIVPTAICLYCPATAVSRVGKGWNPEPVL